MKTLGLLALLPTFAFAQAQPHERLALDIYRELVEINTATATGDTAAAADAMAARLRAAGFPAEDVQVFKPAPRKGNLVARMRGSGAKKPIMLLAHIDVVDARREDWSMDPFKLTEKDGYFYGRGTLDDKFMAAAFVANLIRYRHEGFRPARDLVLVLETDEEVLDAHNVGMRWLLANQRQAIDVEFALNEGAGVGLKNGRPIRNGLQTSEKVYADFRLEVLNRGGHSSQPRPDNAINQLAAALGRIARHEFPVSLNETTRLWFERSAPFEDAQTGADMKALAAGRADAAAIARLSARPGYNAQMRTTCIATQLQGGHAPNALPQMARANINCRILPGQPVEEVRQALIRIASDENVSVTLVGQPMASPASPLRPDLVQAIEKLSGEFWPGVPLIPSMSAGGTTGTILRSAGIPTYGHSGLAGEIEDNRAHGKDERVLVKSFYEGLEYLYRLVKAISQ